MLEDLKKALSETEFAKRVESHPEGDGFLLRVLRATMKDKKSTRVFQLEPAIERALVILKFLEKHKVYTE